MKASEYKSGNEFAPYHPSASHVEPPYRDGWNACYKAAMAQLAVKNEEVERLKKDAARYQWLRMQHWNGSPLCVVTQPKTALKLGFDCPSLLRLDDAIDAAMTQEAKS